jgi:hypothetical protein
MVQTQLQSLLLMNLEMRPVQFEDTARMVVGLGHRKAPMEFIEEIGESDGCFHFPVHQEHYPNL